MSHSTATLLGLLGFGAFIVAVVALAAGITWVVVKLSRTDGSRARPAQAQTSPHHRSGRARAHSA